ncbi:MAG: cytochrome c biogenesis protein CcsA [Chlorobi bacterium]|nr:cytochrome c biogenesis protein CcsA [Chlorobiota bacterium]
MIDLPSVGHFLIIWTWILTIIGSFLWILVWKRSELHVAARIITVSHVIIIAIVLGILMYLFYANRFDVLYVWKYSKRNLEPWFKPAALWSGQEGSFLIWALFQGIVIVWMMTQIKDKAVYPAVAVAMVSQAFLLTMVTGLKIGDFVLGSSPFVLLKEAYLGDVIFYVKPDFVPPDGNGLNPLLRNYWMIIHPPMLFFGYATALPLFAVGVAALITKKWRELSALLHYWYLAVLFFLGLGIFLGAVWAYESLSFGGYWIWDPVENASFVPWVLSVAGLHLIIVYRRRRKQLLLALLFAGLTYVFVLYSSFLTRSGILGESSVHSFTDLGLSGQLVAYLLFFAVVYLALIIWRWRELISSGDESMWSREFWLSIGSLVLFLSAFQIFVDTSRPVWNKLFGLAWAPPADPVAYYNSWQLPFAVIVLLLSGLALFLVYGKKPPRKNVRLLIIAFILSTLFSLFFIFKWNFTEVKYILLLFASIWAMVSSAIYWIEFLKGSWRQVPVFLSHFGLGLFVLGVLISSARKEVLKPETASMGEHILLFKNEPVSVKKWLLTYINMRKQGDYVYFDIKMTDTVKRKEIHITPEVLIEGENIVANPDITKFAGYDLFVHVNSMPQNIDLTPSIRTDTLRVGDTLHTQYGILQLIGLEPHTRDEDGGPIGVFAVFNLHTGSKIITLKPGFFLVNNSIQTVIDTAYGGRLAIRFRTIITETDQYVFDLQEVPRDDWIVLRAIIFPYINLVWLGGVMMVLGGLLGIILRRWNK